MKELDVNSFNRMYLAIMEKFNCSIEEARDRLSSLKLVISCGAKIVTDCTSQVALITAINSGRRAFLGGVEILLPLKTKSLLNWPGLDLLDDIVCHLGGHIITTDPLSHPTLYVGHSSNEIDGYHLVYNDWQGGILIPGDKETFLQESNIGGIYLGAIASAAIGIGLLFQKHSEICSGEIIESQGISLWRPDLNWLEDQACGPPVKYLPKQFWIIGLGHLGQAFLWNVSFLPYPNSSEILFILQDQDMVVKANEGSGLLTSVEAIGKMKTRVCSIFLEKRGFQTRIIERFADEYTKCVTAKEPSIALCGLDELEPRIKLGNSQFSYLIDCGLGGELTTFDDIMICSNPSSKVYSIWKERNISRQNKIHSKTEDKLKDYVTEGCGILAREIAGKAISSSYVGCLAGSLVVADLLRCLNDGYRYEQISVQLRALRCISTSEKLEYKNELTPNGFVTI